MTYALRKLIAFVFLGGIFWFVYRDLGEMWNPSFQLSVGILVAAFALVWLIVPVLVVYFRSRARVRRNRAGYAAWLAALPPEGPRPLAGVGERLVLAEGERAYLVEKGTLYVTSGCGYDALSVPGAVGEVAFPGQHRINRKVQRVRCYLTDRRLVFCGKELRIEWPLQSPFAYRVSPGGLVFERTGASGRALLAFTFTNPLVTADLLGRLMHQAAGC